MQILEIDRNSLPFNGKALLSARSLRGLTQVELAARVGLSRQQIYNLERGDVKSPPPSTVRALAAALSVQPDYFARTPREMPTREVLHLRKKRRLSEKTIEQLLSRAEHFESVVEHLLVHANFRAVNLPKASVRSPDEIERAAELCREKWGAGPGPLDNVTRAVENAGAFVGAFGPEDDGVDAFSWRGVRPLLMYNKAAPSRGRFSLAHECGHLVMHEGQKTGDAESEAEANRFAGALLIPRASFFREFPRSGSRLAWDGMLRMKEHWKVSLQAILHRARDLDIIGADTYRWSCVHITQRGWRKAEPCEPTEEPPEVLPSALKYFGFTAPPGFTLRLLEETTGVLLQEEVADLDLNKVISLLAEARKHQRSEPEPSGAKAVLGGLAQVSAALSASMSGSLCEQAAAKALGSGESQFAKLLGPLLSSGRQVAPDAADAPHQRDVKKTVVHNEDSPFAKLLGPLLSGRQGAPAQADAPRGGLVDLDELDGARRPRR